MFQVVRGHARPWAGEGAERQPSAGPAHATPAQLPAGSAPGQHLLRSGSLPPPAPSPLPSLPASPLPQTCTGQPRKPRLNSGTSGPHLHATSSPKFPNTPVFHYGATPARSACSPPRLPAPAHHDEEGAPPSQHQLSGAARLRGGTRSVAVTRPYWGPPYIARGRSARGRAPGGPSPAPFAQARRVETRN